MAKLSREYFKRLVADHQLDNLIEELFQLLTNFLATRKDKIVSDIYDSLILISGKYKTIKHENLLGIMDSADSSLELNKVGYSLISIINNIPDLVFDYHSDNENKIESTRDKIKKINTSSEFDYDIFLSFSSKDLREAKKLTEELRGYGLRIFLSDEVLKSNVGTSFFEKIEFALRNSKNFMLLITSNAMQSEWVKTEYETFYNEYFIPNKSERKFIAFKGVDFDVAVIPSLLKRLQFANNTSEVLQSYIEEDEVGRKVIEDKRRKKQEDLERQAIKEKQNKEREDLERKKVEGDSINAQGDLENKENGSDTIYKTRNKNAKYIIIGVISILLILIFFLLIEKRSNPDTSNLIIGEASTTDTVKMIQTDPLAKSNDNKINDSKKVNKENNEIYTSPKKDIFEVISILPPVNTSLFSNSSFEINMRIRYNLVSTDSARFHVFLEQFINECGAGSHHTIGGAEAEKIKRGEGEMNIVINYKPQNSTKGSQNGNVSSFFGSINANLWAGWGVPGGKDYSIQSAIWNYRDLCYVFQP